MFATVKNMIQTKYTKCTNIPNVPNNIDPTSQRKKIHILDIWLDENHILDYLWDAINIFRSTKQKRTHG